MSVLIIPCYIKTKWDIDCLNRLLQSVQVQTIAFEKVYVVDDASPMQYTLSFDFIEHIKLSENTFLVFKSYSDPLPREARPSPRQMDQTN